MKPARLSLLLIAVLCAAAVQAQQYPSKPIRFIVGFPPGGGTDIVTRLIAAKLTESWGQQTIVDNRPGATGMIAAQLVSKAPADGYTLLMSYDGTMAINPGVYRKMPFDPVKDFVPVASVAQLPLLLMDLSELVWVELLVLEGQLDLVPMALRIGRACSSVAASPPVMTASVAATAPVTPPLTGASRNFKPRALAAASILRAVEGNTLLRSMSTAPFLAVSMAPPVLRAQALACVTMSGVRP